MLFIELNLTVSRRHEHEMTRLLEKHNAHIEGTTYAEDRIKGELVRFNGWIRFNKYVKLLTYLDEHFKGAAFVI